jgi:hypothetical protein
MRDLSAGPLLLGSSAMYVGLRLEVQPLHRQFVPRASSNVLASKPSAGRRDVPERRQLAHRCRVHGNRDRERRRWIIGCGCAWRQRTPAIRQGRPPAPRRSSKAIRSSAGFATRTRCRNRYSRISRCSRRLAGTSSACRRVRVAAKNRGPSYRLPDLRFRHAVGLHCPGHENVDAALKNGASCQSWCANIPPRIGITAVLHTWAPIASTTRNRMTRQARTSGVPSRLRSKKRVGRERERCSFDSLLQNIGDSNHRSGKSITVNF